MIGTVGTLFALAFLAGCSSQQPRTQSPNDVIGTMKSELSHSLAQADTFDTMDDELSHAIGTTTVTGAEMLGPMPLPESRMSLAIELSPYQTWGVPPQDPVRDEMSPTRD